MAALFAVPLVTFAGPVGPRGSEIVSPTDRFAITQLIGGGYVVNPRFRFGMMGIFNEAFTGLSPRADAWQFGGVAPMAIGTLGTSSSAAVPSLAIARRQAPSGCRCDRAVGSVDPSQKRPRAQHRRTCVCAVEDRTTASVGVAAGVAKVF